MPNVDALPDILDTLIFTGDGMCRFDRTEAEPPHTAPASFTARDFWAAYPIDSVYTGGRWRLRAARKAKRLTQTELAAKVGINHQSLMSGLEAGALDCGPAVWRRLEAALGVPAAELRAVAK
jgi:DNA-binding XRE family transcriptional regulator